MSQRNRYRVVSVQQARGQRAAGFGDKNVAKTYCRGLNTGERLAANLIWLVADGDAAAIVDTQEQA